MNKETEALEEKKAEWTAIQLDIAQRAVFNDHNLSFTVSADSSAIIGAPNEPLEPKRQHVQGTVHGLHTVGGLDISFFKNNPDEAIATLTVLSFPSMDVSRFSVKAPLTWLSSCSRAGLAC